MQAGRLPIRAKGPDAQPIAADRIWSRWLIAFRASDPVRPARRTVGVLRAAVFRLAAVYAQVLRRCTTQDSLVSTDRVEWVRLLESNWRVIRDELDCLRASFDLPALIDVIPGERGVADAGWEMFILRYFGRPIPENCALCPRTAALVEQVPGLLSANFSVLQPGTRIAPHHGIFAGVLRYHLGLIVPPRTDLCGIRIGDETRHWQEGTSLLFDDTRRHEAWNYTDQERTVLLLDVKRPLPAPLRWLNDCLLFLMSRLIMPPLARAERMIPAPASRPVAGASVQVEPTLRP